MSERRDFTAVHQAYASYVRSLARQLAPPRDAEDVAQESFLKIHRALPRYDPTRPLKPWIKTIVARIVRDHLQRCSSRCELLVDQTAPDLRSDSEELLGTLELLRDVLAPLSDRQRAIVVRYLRDEEPVEEIAQDLELSSRGAYKLLNAARAKLADAMRPTIARAMTAVPAPPMASNAPAPAKSAAAPLPAFSAKSAPGRSSRASKGSPALLALLEHRSLDRIEALLKTDPAAALAALELHKKTFPGEELRAERNGIEELTRARTASLRPAQKSAAPP